MAGIFTWAIAVGGVKAVGEEVKQPERGGRGMKEAGRGLQLRSKRRTIVMSKRG